LLTRFPEIRRVSVPRPATFEAFRAALVEALDLSKRPMYTGELRITYEDEEGDKVTVATNADFLEMLRQHSNDAEELLRIAVVPGKVHGHSHGGANKTDEEGAGSRCGRHFRHFGRHLGPLHGLLQQLKVGLPELLENPALRSMAEGLISANSGLVRIDTGRVCDACNSAIMGDRFASTTKSDFDLCSACMLSEAGQKLEPEHKFKKVAAFDALLDCLRQGGGVDAFFAGGEKEEAGPVAHHATCDVCSQTIVGSRFKSMAERDYDECAACRAKSSKPADEFFEMKDPAVRTIPEEARAAFEARKQQQAEKSKEAPRLVQPKPIVVEQPKPVAAVVVVEQPKVAEQPKPVAPPAEPERQPSAFEVNLQTLESMGFNDRRKNITILVRARNQLFDAIQQLLE
jgi:hypothetical protein